MMKTRSLFVSRFLISTALCATLFGCSTASIAQEPQTFEKRVYRFHSDEQWRSRLAADAPEVAYRFGYNEPSYVLQIEPSDSNFRLEVRSDVAAQRTRHLLHNPLSLTFDFQDVAGDGVTVYSSFVDEGGETHVLRPQSIPTGDSKLTWSFADDVVSSSGGDRNGRIDGDLRLDTIYFSRAGEEEGPASLRLYWAYYTGQPDPVRFHFAPSDPVNHVRPGEESKARLVFESDFDKPIDVVVEAALRDYTGNTRTSTNTFTLKPGGPHDWPLPFELRATGPKRLSLLIKHPTQTEKAQIDFAYMDPAGVTPHELRKFRFGTNANRTANAEAQAREFRAMGFIGIDIARCGYDWWEIEKTQGNWDWSLLDRMYAQAELNQVDIQTALLFSVPWAARPEFIEANKGKTLTRKQYWTAAPRVDLWRDYVRRHTERYRGRVAMYEIWNEPDLRGFFRGNTDQYLEILRAAYEEIKSIHPEQVVMSPGLAHAGHYHGHYLNPDLYERVMREGQDYFDVYAAHEHGTFETFQRVVDGPLARMRSYLDPPKPLMFNETALSSYPHGQKTQAETLVKKLAFAWGRGASGYFWFNHRERAGETPSERGFGSITPDFQPKAVYCAYNELIKLLRGKEFVHEVDLGTEQWGFVFGDEHEQVLVYWASDLPVPSTRPYALPTTEGATLEAMDIMGNRTPQPSNDGYVLLTPTPTPRYLILKGTQTFAAAGAPLVTRPADGMELLRPGTTGEAAARMHNPLPREAVYELSWVLPKGVTSEAHVKQTLTIPAGASADARLPIKVSDTGVGETGQRGSVELGYHLQDTNWQGQLTVPVAVPLVFSGDVSFDRVPDIVLDRYAQVKNFAENDPSSEHLTWQGVEDLSAKAWVGLGESAIHLRVDVMDDRHVQPKRRRSIWQGDSIQFGLTLPSKPGQWEIGFARTADDTPVQHVWNLPAGTDGPDVVFDFTYTPIEGGLRYDVRLPYDVLGWHDDMRTAGVGLNLSINDNDAGSREGVIRFAPGIGPEPDAALYPVVVFP